MTRSHRSRRGMRRLPFLLLLLLCGTLFFRWSNHSLQVQSFTFSSSRLPDGFTGCRLVLLADLHGAEFGEGNQRLFDAVEQQQPDAILYLGDLEDLYRGSVEGYAEEIADGLTAIAPTYYVTGNHEWAIGGVPQLKERLREHGVTVLSNQFVPLERNGDVILLAGIDDPNGYADQETPEELAAELRESCGDPFWILMAHRNDHFAQQYSALGADLVCSGHGHGGLIRLPFTDGLVGTQRNLFPSYTAGFYEANGSTLFVSRGLGNSGRTFRLFNRPQVAVITLTGA